MKIWPVRPTIKVLPSNSAKSISLLLGILCSFNDHFTEVKVSIRANASHHPIRVKFQLQNRAFSAVDSPKETLKSAVQASAIGTLESFRKITRTSAFGQERTYRHMGDNLE